MSQKTVLLSDVLKAMSTPDAKGRAVPFSISFRTLNKNSKTGGRLVRYPKAKLLMKEDFGDSTTVKRLRQVASTKKSSLKKNPNHWDNKTRNIKTMPEGRIKKIHINYIIEFNDQKVVY